jgi:hypothetical protein
MAAGRATMPGVFYFWLIQVNGLAGQMSES